MLDDEILKVINSLHQILGGLRGSSRSRPSIKGSEALGQDLYLVAVGMRMACLIDSMRPSTQQLNSIKVHLQDELPGFDCVIFVATCDGDQVFVVNLPMLSAALADRSHWTCFVSMRHKTVEKCNSAPSEIIQTLEGIVASQLTPTHVVYMMPVLEPGSLIALAGYLLEYPFSYYPEPLFDTDPFLCSTSLVVYSCCMESIATKKRYPIIKFSCPASILETEVARETLRDIIMDRWTTRLMDKPFSSMQRIQVIYELQSVDRVAL